MEQDYKMKWGEAVYELSQHPMWKWYMEMRMTTIQQLMNEAFALDLKDPAFGMDFANKKGMIDGAKKLMALEQNYKELYKEKTDGLD